MKLLFSSLCIFFVFCNIYAQRQDSLLTVGIEFLQPIVGYLGHDTYVTEAFAKYDIFPYLTIKVSGGGSMTLIDQIFINLYDYKIIGIFYKLGVYFTLKKKIKGVILFTGINFVGSRYNESGTFIIEEPYWGNYYKQFENNNVVRNGYEFETGYELLIKKSLFISPSIRIRSINQYKSTIPVPYIPGFGKIRRTNIGINLSMIYKLNCKRLLK